MLPIECRESDAASQWWKANCSDDAEFSADPAFDPLPGKAVVVDLGARRPGWLLGILVQGAGLAGLDAARAKGAFADTEVDCRIAAIERDDDLRRASTKAVAAARAGAQEILLGKRPGRAQGALAGREFSAQKISATGRCGHGRNATGAFPLSEEVEGDSPFLGCLPAWETSAHFTFPPEIAMLSVWRRIS